MPRGGYQKPSKPAPASGPGKFSKRTDGGVQPISEPDIDTAGLEYGDRGRLTEAQRIAHAAAGQGAQAGPTRSTGQVSRGAKLPSFLFEGDSRSPMQPGTAGLSSGPGPGPEALAASEPAPDIREQVLEYLVENFSNPEAQAMLADIRAQAAAATQTPTVPTGVLDAEPALTEPATPGAPQQPA